MITIEEANISQLPQLMQWRMRVLAEVFATEPTSQLYDANVEYYKRQMSQGGHVACWAREDDGATIGCGGMCIYPEMPSPDNPTGACAYLMNIYVVPEMRHHHVGAAIVSWLLDQAAARGIKKIYLETSADGRPLYTSMGFEDMPDMMKFTPPKYG